MTDHEGSDVILRPFRAGEEGASGGRGWGRGFPSPDEDRLVEVMATTFAEYGMTFEPDGWDRDVREVATRYAAPGAAFFSGCDAASGRALGFVGVDLVGPGTAELHRLYIDPAARGRRLGQRLCGAAEAWALARGARVMALWSDVRFTHAHRLYAGRGYRLTGQRLIGDPDRSVEFGFTRELPEGAPVAHVAAAARAIPIAQALADPGLGHRARMVAAALIDSRALVLAGRMEGAAHELPHPDEVFRARPTREVPRPPPNGASATGLLMFESDIAVGFTGRLPSGGSVRVLHPLFGDG